MDSFLRPFRRPPPPPAPPPPELSGDTKLRYLAEAVVFRDLNAEQIAELGRVTAMTTCKRGRTFYVPGETGEALFILKQGRVHVVRMTPDGRKIITATLGPGTIFGEMALAGQGMGGSYAEAADDCTLCVMSRADLELLIETHPKVALRLIEALASRLADTEARLEALAFQTVTGRLAATLLRLAADQGRDDLQLTHQDLADLVGAYRETTTRILNELRAKGLIDLHRQRIQIVDSSGLRALAGSQ